MKGVNQGTPGGALTTFTPTLMALMPLDTNTGMEARVKPGTSRCTARHGTQQSGTTGHQHAALAQQRKAQLEGLRRQAGAA